MTDDRIDWERVTGLVDDPGLSARDRSLLAHGVGIWGGPAKPTDALARAMGFADVIDLYAEGARLRKALLAGEPLSQHDWARVLIATEIAWGSDYFGSGVEWFIVTGHQDAETNEAMRRIQRRLVGATLDRPAPEDRRPMRWLGRDEHGNWDPDFDGYNARLKNLKYVLWPTLRPLIEMSLHDGLIEKLVVNERKRTVSLRLVVGDLQQGYRQARFKYHDASLRVVGADLRWLVEYEHTELLAHELDRTRDDYEHRLLFWPAGELHITFSTADFETRELPGRDRKGPRFIWRD